MANRNSDKEEKQDNNLNYFPTVFLGEKCQPEVVKDSYRNHSKIILAGIHQHYKDQRFCDVTLVFGSKEIKAHRVVLASSCPYFKAMFDFNSAESAQQRIEIKNIGEHAGEALIEYAYTGRIKITSENVIELLAGANFLQGFEIVEKSCSDYLKYHCMYENMLQLFQVADYYQQNDLKKYVKKCCIKTFVKCVESDYESFLNLQEGLLKELISDQTLVLFKDYIILHGGKQEEYLLEKVIKYLEYNQTPNLQAAEILKCIHLPLLEQQSLQALKTNQLLTNKECLAIIEDAVETKRTKITTESQLQPDWAKKRPCGEHKFWSGLNMAIIDKHEMGKTKKLFDDFDLVSHEVYITGIEFWISQWKGRPVLGGIRAHYSNGNSIMHGEDKAEHKQDFMLKPSERILRVDSQGDRMIDSLIFYTNQNRKLGPFVNSSSYGDFHQEIPPRSGGHLAFINGIVMELQNKHWIPMLQFVWRFFKIPDPFCRYLYSNSYNSNDDERDREYKYDDTYSLYDD